MPTSRIAIISSDVATGRSIKRREGFKTVPYCASRRQGLPRRARGRERRPGLGVLMLMLAGWSGCGEPSGLAPVLPAWPRRWDWPRRAWPALGAGGRRIAHHDLGAFAKPVGAVDHDLVADRQARGDRRAAGIGRPDLDLAHGDGAVVLDDIRRNCRSARAALRRVGQRPRAGSVSTSRRALTNWLGNSAPSRWRNSRAV